MNDYFIKIAAVGDIALTHDYDQLLSMKGQNYPFEKVKELFKDIDVVLGNLEAPISSRGERYPLKCSLRTNPKYAEGLKSAGFNIMSLSNNHILDYKENAFYDTFANLDKQGIKYFGAGKNIRDARKPAILEIRNIKIGFLGYCDVVIDSPFYSSADKRGIVPLKIEFVKEDIANLKDQVDIVIVSLHWGTENWSYPSPKQIKMAHQIIDFGANMIFGHHPHVLQGVEKYNKGYIAYSLGNFIFSEITWLWINDSGKRIRSRVELFSKNRESAILKVIMNGTGIKSIDLIPCVISTNHQPVIDNKSYELRKKIGA